MFFLIADPHDIIGSPLLDPQHLAPPPASSGNLAFASPHEGMVK